MLYFLTKNWVSRRVTRRRSGRRSELRYLEGKILRALISLSSSKRYQKSFDWEYSDIGCLNPVEMLHSDFLRQRHGSDQKHPHYPISYEDSNRTPLVLGKREPSLYYIFLNLD